MPKDKKFKDKTIHISIVNGVGVTWRQPEFLLKFYHNPTDSDGFVPMSRVYMLPEIAKALYLLLKQSVEDYEKEFHKIDVKLDESNTEIEKENISYT